VTAGTRQRERGVPDGEPVPAVVESPRAKLVYHYVRTAGGASPERIAGALDMTRLSVLPVLATLARRGVVERTDEGYVVRRDR